MATTQIKKELATYLPLLSERQQEILLNMVKSFLHIDKGEKRVSKEEYNKEINEALKQIKSGKTVSHKKIRNQTEKWLKRK